MTLDKVHEILEQAQEQIIEDHEEALANACKVFGGCAPSISTFTEVYKGPLAGKTVEIKLEVRTTQNGE